MMHLKLNDITDKQFSLNQLSEIYKIPQREILQQKTPTKRLCFLKLKSRLELNKPIVGWVYDFLRSEFLWFPLSY
jgi:DNA polymerase-3 subunit epsilon